MGNNPINRVDPLGLFGRDVHFDLTYDLALQAGFTQANANTIASANQGLDDNFLTGPFNVFGGTQLHFMSPEKAKRVIIQSIQTNNLKDFGKSLHKLQDTYSHYKQGYRWYSGGHIKYGHNPDTSYVNTNTQDMTYESLNYLKQFKKAFYSNCRN